jgi:hypothetical protein
VLRRKYRLDEPGAQVELTERADGVIEMRPTLAVPAAQAWFWTDRWQRGEQGEQEVDEHIDAGRVAVHADGEEFVRHLKALDELDNDSQGEFRDDADV